MSLHKGQYFIFAMGDRKSNFQVYAVKAEGPVWTEVGSALFWVMPKTIKCSSVFVDEKHRRQGIATAIYRYASLACHTKKLVPSHNQTPMGKAFWKDLRERL